MFGELDIRSSNDEEVGTLYHAFIRLLKIKVQVHLKIFVDNYNYHRSLLP